MPKPTVGTVPHVPPMPKGLCTTTDRRYLTTYVATWLHTAHVIMYEAHRYSCYLALASQPRFGGYARWAPDTSFHQGSLPLPQCALSKDRPSLSPLRTTRRWRIVRKERGRRRRSRQLIDAIILLAVAAAAAAGRCARLGMRRF